MVWTLNHSKSRILFIFLMIYYSYDANFFRDFISCEHSCVIYLFLFFLFWFERSSLNQKYFHSHISLNRWKLWMILIAYFSVELIKFVEFNRPSLRFYGSIPYQTENVGVKMLYINILYASRLSRQTNSWNQQFTANAMSDRSIRHCQGMKRNL